MQRKLLARPFTYYHKFLINKNRDRKDKPMSTDDELMQNPDFKRKHEESYRDLVLSE